MKLSEEQKQRIDSYINKLGVKRITADMERGMGSNRLMSTCAMLDTPLDAYYQRPVPVNIYLDDDYKEVIQDTISFVAFMYYVDNYTVFSV